MQTLKILIAEEERIAQEHKENLASGKVKKIEERTIPKQKAIVIKENVSSQSVPTRNIIFDVNPKDKGKAKVGETPRSTSNKAQVDTQGDKSTSDKAQVEKQKQTVATSDRAQVVQSKLSSALQSHFIRPNATSQETGYDKNSLIDLNIKAKSGGDRSGLGHTHEKHCYNNPRDPSSLSVPGKGVT